MAYRKYLSELRDLPAVLRNFVTADRSGIKFRYVSYGDHPRQYMMVCESYEAAPERDAFIFFVHGGGWRLGKPERYLPAARLFCPLGYKVVLTTYRLVPQFSFPHLREDIFLSYQRCLSLPDLQGKRGVPVGISAGGNLCGLLLYDREEQRKYGISQQQFAAFVAVSGAMDLRTFPDTLPLRDYAGPFDGPQFHAANPATHLRADEQLPVLCVHGTRDAIVPYESSVAFVNQLNASPARPADLHTVPGGSHFKTTTQWWLRYNSVTDVVVDWIEQRVGSIGRETNAYKRSRGPAFDD